MQGSVPHGGAVLVGSVGNTYASQGGGQVLIFLLAALWLPGLAKSLSLREPQFPDL